MSKLAVTPEEAYETLLDAASEPEEDELNGNKLYAIEFSHVSDNGAIETEVVWLGTDETMAHEWVVENHYHWLSVYQVQEGRFSIVVGEPNSDELSIHWTYICKDGDLFKWVA